ncbi:hypothetical protein L596_021033 [Steinernema carpocapsae]|uniref:Uncharacterized protein n=1 Tax=Steinernema carpocapsae TaxID=34508 RepID=A0A4U5MVH2_STECR|nr:hypothetical protein L596_021033 [Steinernema carpocapsae]
MEQPASSRRSTTPTTAPFNPSTSSSTAELDYEPSTASPRSTSQISLQSPSTKKILVNKESLVEYNRLRSTIDLPAFDVPVQEPSRKRPFDFNKRQNVKQVVMTPIAIQKPAVTKKKPRLKEDLETEDPMMPTQSEFKKLTLWGVFDRFLAIGKPLTFVLPFIS